MTGIVGVTIGWALPALAAWALIDTIPRRAGGALKCVGQVATAAILGAGVSSLLPFAWLIGGGALDGRFVVVDAMLFGCLACAGLVNWRRRRIPGQAGRTSDADSRWPSALLLTALVVAVTCAVTHFRAVPSGEFDAWAIWNMRARFLFRSGAAWREAFAPELGWTSTEYPLLLPLAIARLWAYGGESQLAPALLALTFTTGVPLVVGAWTAGLAGTRAGALGGLVLLGTPGFVSLGASQYADVPVAAFIVSGMSLLSVGGARSLMAGGISLGLAAWTKNEGIPAALIALVVHALSTWWRDGRRPAIRAVVLIAGGAAPVALIWIAFHALVTPRVSGVLFSGMAGPSAATRLTDVSRWAQVGKGLVLALPGARVGFPAIVAVLAFLAGGRPSRLLFCEASYVATGMLLGVYAAFLATSWDLSWHLNTAADRVVLQAWPVIVGALFSTIPRPR